MKIFKLKLVNLLNSFTLLFLNYMFLQYVEDRDDRSGRCKQQSINILHQAVKGLTYLHSIGIGMHMNVNMCVCACVIVRVQLFKPSPSEFTCLRLMG